MPLWASTRYRRETACHDTHGTASFSTQTTLRGMLDTFFPGPPPQSPTTALLLRRATRHSAHPLKRTLHVSLRSHGLSRDFRRMCAVYQRADRFTDGLAMDRLPRCGWCGCCSLDFQETSRSAKCRLDLRFDSFHPCILTSVPNYVPGTLLHAEAHALQSSQ